MNLTVVVLKGIQSLKTDELYKTESEEVIDSYPPFNHLLTMVCDHLHLKRKKVPLPGEGN